jgi:predicted dehydrogenase
VSGRDFVGVGVIGTGFARTTQLPAFRACEGARVVAIASGRRENAERAAREFDIPFATDDWREVVAREDVDLVSVVTPPVTHEEMTLAAFDAGKGVLCEKPAAMNADESRRMRDRAAESRLFAHVDHELRFLPSRRRMREMILAGEVGRVRHANVLFRSDSRAAAGKAWDWWSDEKAGGGVLGAIGSHAVDALRWLLGAEVSEVSAALATHVTERVDGRTGAPRRVTTDDEATMLLRFADAGAAGLALGGRIGTARTPRRGLRLRGRPARERRAHAASLARGRGRVARGRGGGHAVGRRAEGQRVGARLHPLLARDRRGPA